MKKLLTLAIASFLFSFCTVAQQFTKVTGSVVTNVQEGYGSTWADYDKDGDLDIYVNVRSPSVNNPNGYNYLFQNNCNGDFTRIIAIPGGLVSDPTTGQQSPATWIDYDNDGDDDLFISRPNTTNLLYRNNGDGAFTKITDISFVNDTEPTRCHSFIDFDNDGDLDLLLVRPVDFNTMYRNDGNETYTPLQPFFQDSIATMVGIWGDYDNDGYMDLFVTKPAFSSNNPTGDIRIFHNNGNGTFTQVINNVPATSGNYQYSASWIDYDNDRDVDIFVRGSFFTPNRLYRNDGNGIFVNIPGAGGITSTVHNNGGVAWGDYDNDGDLDLYLSAPDAFGPEPFEGNFLYKNNGNGTFTEDSTEIVTNDDTVESYGGAFADYDNDGDLDLYVSNAFGEGESFLYRNNGGSSHWFDVKCKGVISNENAIGARIFVKATISGQPRWQMREINTNLSFAYGGVAPYNQHFGLGDATVIDSLKIVWPVSNTTQIFTNVSSDRFIEITEGVNAIADAMPCRPDLLPVNPAVITGKVFSDTDNDCVFNSSNDFPIANRIMQATPGPDFVFSNNNGDYEFRLNGGTYQVTQAAISNDLWNLQTCQPNSAYTVSVNNGDTAAGKNFSLNAISSPTCNATVDINSIPMVFADNCPSGLLLITPCPGSMWKYCVTVTNTGINSPILTGSTLQIVLDPSMSYAGIIESNTCNLTGPVIGAGNTLTWTVPNAVVLGSTGSFCTICFDVNVGFPAQLSYLSTANFTANCPNGNAFPTDQAPDGAACSCDPNDKLVAPKGCGALGNISKNQPLTYTVRFQNTGTGPAHDVVIRDVLDSDLDITTLKIIASNHNITHIQIIPDNALIISYEGIELPDSGSSQQGSNGFVAFSINPKNNLPDGTQITNQAGIYFDFNEVVLTNSTLNTLRDNPEPIADFESKHNCSNTGLVYDFFYTGGTADNATFFWDFGNDATPQTSTQQNPSGVLFSSTGTKSVTLTVTRFGCTAAITKSIEVIDVHCGSNKVQVCHKGKILCVSTGSLQAHLNHGDCIGQCETSSFRKANTISYEEGIYEIIFEAFPNPATEETKIEFTLPEAADVDIEIYNYTGQIVRKLFIGKIEANKKNELFLNRGDMSSGIYFLKLQTEKELRVIKLVLLQ